MWIFFLRPTSTKLTVKIFRNIQKQYGNITFKHRFFFLFFFVVFVITLRSSVVWCFDWWSLMYTSAMHFWYCIHLLNTPLYINVLIPCHSKFVFLFFCCWERETWWRLSKKFVMQSDHSASVFTFVCVFVCLIEIIRTTTTWTETEETLLTDC